MEGALLSASAEEGVGQGALPLFAPHMGGVRQCRYGEAGEGPHGYTSRANFAALELDGLLAQPSPPLLFYGAQQS
jgi:hypothetical protein